MVRFEAEGGVDPLLRATLDKGDSVATESGAMVAMDATATSAVITLLPGDIGTPIAEKVGSSIPLRESF